MEACEWKHLYRQRGVIIARVSGKKYVGSFSCIIAAKKALAKHLKVTVADLPRRQNNNKNRKKTARAPPTQGVYLREGMCEARDPATGEYLGRFTSEFRAKAAIRKAMQGDQAIRKARKKQEKLCVVRTRFRALIRMFSDT